MTLRFYSGIDYNGIVFTTAQEGLEVIRDSLIGAGWFVELDDINPNLELKMKGFDEDQPAPKDECFIRFYSTAATEIRCLMYFNDGTLHESAHQTFNIYDGVDNLLYLTCDSGSGVIMIVRNGYFSDGLFYNMYETVQHPSANCVHFGFLKRVSLADTNAVYFGKPDYRLDTCLAQQTSHHNEIWENIHRTWYDGNNYYDQRTWNSTRVNMPIHTTIDFISVTGFENSFDYHYSQNAAYKMYRGSQNAVTSLPFLNNYGYIEGWGRDSNAYGANMGDFPHHWYFRGWVKFIATGMGSLLPLQQIEEPNGTRWMSTGKAGWQGMQISAAI